MDTDYIAISLATLRPGNSLGTDLYSQDAATKQMRLYKKSDYPLKEDDLRSLQKGGVRRLFIMRDGHERYQEYLRLILAEDNRQLPHPERVGAMDEVVRDVLQECFKAHDVEQTVQSASNLGALIVGVICDERFVVSDLFRILHHDYTTFTHSVNVAYYAVMLAKELGMSMSDLRKIAAGAILHDLGKLDISDVILRKPGRLDAVEFRRVKQHPLDGFRNLCGQAMLTQGQLMMVYQHHERLDGRGYPVGCVSDEIHPWAKLCTVVNAFEGLTSSRPYRCALTHQQALEQMERDCGAVFDLEMFQCWKQIIQSCSLA